MHGWMVKVAEVDLGGVIGKAALFWAVAAQTREEALEILAKTPGSGPKPGYQHEVAGFLSQETIKALGLAPGQACAM